MKQSLKKTFQVPEGLILESVEEKPDGDTVLCCKAKKQKVCCKHCGGKTNGYDRRVTNKKHTVVSGKTIWLRISRPRVQCKNCKKVFVVPIEGTSRDLYTDHFTQQVQERGRGQDYTTIHREMGVSCATISNRMTKLDVDLIRTETVEGGKKRSVSE